MWLRSLESTQTNEHFCTNIITGSEFVEVNTGKKFMFDETGSEWDVDRSGGGAGADVNALLRIIQRNNSEFGSVLTLPESITKLGSYSLAGISGPTTLVAPEVTTLSVASSFYDCSFEKIYLPKLVSVTTTTMAFANANGSNGTYEVYLNSLETIPANMFSGSKASKVILPSAKIIGNSFAGASKLEEIYIGPNCTEIPAGSFGGAGTSGKTLTINCGFAEGTITTNWLVGIVATPPVNYNVPIPTITLPS